MRRSLLLLAGCLALMIASPVWAQSQAPTLFVAEFSATDPGVEQVSDRSTPIVTVTMHPERTVELLAAPDLELQERIGTPASEPLVIGSRLHGSSNRSSLYCHRISVEMFGPSGTCFRDFDNDGAFEQAVNVDGAGLETDVVILNTRGGWSGGSFDERQRLNPPLEYRPVPEADVPAYPGYLHWETSVTTPDPEDYPVRMWFSLNQGEYTRARSSVTGQCYVTTLYSGDPFTVHLYGNAITVLGFTEEGDLRYVVDPNPERQTVGMIYQFETRDPFIAMALEENHIPLECPDAAAVSPRPGK